MKPSSAGTLRGRMGGIVYLESGDDTIARAWVRPADPKTPGQAAQRRRVGAVGPAWQAMDEAGRVRWRAYARGLGDEGRAYRVFSSLGTRRLRVDPATDLAAFEPPTAAFFGDAARITVSSGSPSPDGTFGREGRGERRPEPSGTHAPQATPSPTVPPSGRASLQGEPSLVFLSDRPNAAGVLTELMVQRLPSHACRSYPEKYRSRGFVAFAGEPVAVLVGTGAWACGYRFVSAETGQTTGIAEIGVVVVGV